MVETGSKPYFGSATVGRNTVILHLFNYDCAQWLAHGVLVGLLRQNTVNNP